MPLDDFPEALQAAARALLAYSAGEDSYRELISGFGELRPGTESHEKAVLFCCHAVRRVIYGWEALGCDGTLPEQGLTAVEQWVFTGAPVADNWTVDAPALRKGRRIVDCDACRAEPIASAVAELASFAQTADKEKGRSVLSDVAMAISEGIESPDSLEFGNWLVQVALPAAWELRKLSEAEIRL